ncbi:MAG: hypothetical protein Q4D91_06270 [Lautropia sp.]|nr:hypothetical protein [Lautropia sp.]
MKTRFAGRRALHGWPAAAGGIDPVAVTRLVPVARPRLGAWLTACVLSLALAGCASGIGGRQPGASRGEADGSSAGRAGAEADAATAILSGPAQAADDAGAPPVALGNGAHPASSLPAQPGINAGMGHGASAHVSVQEASDAVSESVTDEPGLSFCRRFFEALERRVTTWQVADVGQHRLLAYPFLRTNRFLASFADDFRAELDGREDAAALADLAASSAFTTWVERMRALDASVRVLELARMPDEAYPVYQQVGRDDAVKVVQRCSEILASALGAQDVPPLLRAASVPDEYSRTLRALGLYPLTGIGVASSIRNWESHQQAVFREQRQAATFSGKAAFQRYRPADGLSATEGPRQAAEVMATVPRDALGIPRFSYQQQQTLLSAFAPVYDVATINDSDRIGRLHWIDLTGLVYQHEAHDWLDVDTSVPVVYARVDFTRFENQVLPQLVYTIWFSDRPKESRSDLLSGRLDGLVWRVTLDRDGAPLLFDSIQPSGRFAMYFPSSRLTLNEAARQGEQGLTALAYSPIAGSIEQWLGMENPASLSLRISSRTHQLVGVAPAGTVWGKPLIENQPYRLLPEDELRALPKSRGGARSIYDLHGQIAGTERNGRWLLWAMGVSNLGSMRQPGRQPTSLIGRSHFDEARLLDRRYRRVKH